MLTANLWVQAGLVNGAVGTVVAICYNESDGSPPSLPQAVTVQFDSYTGPTLSDGTVPITPLRRTWLSTNLQCSRLQLPLKLAWAITIHKAQGMTLDKVVVDVGKKEFSAGLTFVACSRVRHLKDLLFVPPFPFQRVANLANSQRHKERLQEDERLQRLSERSLSKNLFLFKHKVHVKESSESFKVAAEAEMEGQKPNIPVAQAGDNQCSSEPALIGNSQDVDKGFAESPKVPSSEAKLDGNYSDLFITGVDSDIYQFKYHPVGENWQHRVCQRLGLNYCGPNGVTPGGPEVRLTSPTAFKSIRGDGNCMFRSFSFIITGCTCLYAEL